MNTEIGNVTVQLLRLQSADADYAAGLRMLGRDLARIGAELAARAGELDGKELDPATLFDEPDEHAQRPNGAV
ncbi:hypothetical protein ACIA5G_19365 [Amycolatopsis sp. NPDC051758]|uniref:hypothetical protein n=1 Tax=Amycolatopsis sp. NPDC051758 TaxID=3363935 RepID=UPI0037B9483B